MLPQPPGSSTRDYPFTATNVDLTPRTPEQIRLWPEQVKLLQAESGFEAGVASPEADAFSAHLRSLSPDQLVPFMDQMSFSIQYLHGTHVAGIAVRDNPAARLYVLRETLWWGSVPRVPSLGERAIAARYAQVFADFQKHHVRVVNLSWTGSVADFEEGLKANGRCTSADDCRAQGTELNNVQRDALQAAMAAAPNILFVCIPGNRNENSTFVDVFPGSFSFPTSSRSAPWTPPATRPPSPASVLPCAFTPMASASQASSPVGRRCAHQAPPWPRRRSPTPLVSSSPSTLRFARNRSSICCSAAATLPPMAAFTSSTQPRVSLFSMLSKPKEPTRTDYAPVGRRCPIGTPLAIFSGIVKRVAVAIESQAAEPSYLPG